jgi:chromosome segregation ATPase
MPSYRPDAPIGKSNARAAGRDFRSEIERQLLEIQDAFCAFVDDAERQRQDAEGRLREAERQKRDTEDRLRTIESQKQEVEDQLREAAWRLRKLQKTPAARIARFFGRLNPLRSARKRIR